MLPKLLWNVALATPALVSAALVVSASAALAETAPAVSLINEKPPVAAPVTPAKAIAPVAQTPAELAAPLAQAAAEPAAVNSAASLDQVAQYDSEGSSSLAQVTSITQLSDVQPTDWAYQALQSLVERYGCIAGYPDGTYKGQRALTRFEFAAGMNACLDRINELIAASTADFATKEDLATLQRLQEEFAAELTALRGRVDGLEARTSELEANQFSTTTKLEGEAIFSVGVPIDGGAVNGSTKDQTIAGYRLRLNFDTSFTGEDLLRARLQANDFGDLAAFNSNTSWRWSSDSGSDAISLNTLFYTFPIGPAQVIIGASGTGDSDFVSTTVSPFDDDGSGSLTDGLGSPPQYNFIPGGTGAGAIIGFGEKIPLSLDFGYAAGNAGDPSQGNGLFNGDYGAIAQLSLLTDLVDAAFMYSNSYSRTGFGSNGGFNLGAYDDGVDGGAQIANIYGAQVNFKLGFAEIGGGAMYMPVRVLSGGDRGDYRVWSYQGTLAFRDLGGEGNMLGFLVGVPPRVSGVDSSLFGSLGLAAGATRQDASLLAEAFYVFRLNDNISITPGLIYIQDPGNDNARDDSFVGAIRTTFTF